MVGSMLGGAGWTRFVEPWWFKMTRREVPLGLGGGRLKLLQLSDFHADPMPLDHVARCIRAGLAEKPDLICLTGDFITRKYDQWDAYSALLAESAKAAPTFAILGNHDGGHWARRHGYADTKPVRGLLEKAGVRLLHNEAERFENANGKITLAGLGDMWAQEMEPAAVLGGRKRERDVPLVLMSHNPDTKDALSSYAWDLMLSGHTHGGQLSLPLLGEPFAPIVDKRYVRDLHRIGDRWLYITAGVGCLHTARFNCRPEISLLTLV
jgi:predicted MPP superfamily phosphohydrolase